MRESKRQTERKKLTQHVFTRPMFALRIQVEHPRVFPNRLLQRQDPLDLIMRVTSRLKLMLETEDLIYDAAVHRTLSSSSSWTATMLRALPHSFPALNHPTPPTPSPHPSPREGTEGYSVREGAPYVGGGILPRRAKLRICMSM